MKIIVLLVFLIALYFVDKFETRKAYLTGCKMGWWLYENKATINKADLKRIMD